MACRGCYEKYEEKLGHLFERYGDFVAKYPVVILTVCILTNCLLGIGLVRIKSETSSEVLYTPKNSRASTDRIKIKALFEDKSGENFYSKSVTDAPIYGDVILATKDGSSILTNASFTEIEKIYNNIVREIKIANDAGHVLGYRNVCAVRNSECVVNGDVILTPTFRTMLESGNIQFPNYNGTLLNFVLGDIQNGQPSSATMVRLIFYLQSTASMSEISTKWTKEFLNHLSTLTNPSLDIEYSVSSSLDSELNDNTAGDIVYFSLTFTLMITYASIATAGGDCVSNRQNLGLAGVLAAVLSILGTFGFVSAIGIEFVNIVGVMPFLIIGIGIDDMFILLSGFSNSPVDGEVSDKIRNTMKTSGVSITITSLTNFLAFAIGASSTFTSVRNFCIYTGVAVIFCYANQLTFFMPCMVINERRVQGNRHCGTCLRIPSRRKLEKDSPTSKDYRTSKDPATSKHIPMFKNIPISKQRGNCFICCCTGDPPINRNDNESLFEKYPKIVFTKMVCNIPCKIVIVLIFLGYLGTSIWGSINLQQGLLLSNLVSSDSYFHSYSETFNRYFDNSVVVTFTIDSRQAYADTDTQNHINSLLKEAMQDPDVDGFFTFNWLSDYKNSTFYNSTNEMKFIAGLQMFLNTRMDYRDDIKFDISNQNIESSRFYVLSKHLETSTDQGNFMTRMRRIADNSELPCFAYAPAFIFYEQYVIILSSTLQTVGIAVAVMFVITCIFMPQPLLVLLVLVTMVMILIGIFGFMYYWDLTLSSVTMIHLIMSVGFSVDFSTHICHAFISGQEISRNDRVKGAFNRAGGPIFNSATSSFVGIIMLTASSSYIFLSFFKMMLLVIVFGLAHAIFLLPVVLSIIGPKGANEKRPHSTFSECSRNRVSPNSLSKNEDIEISPTNVSMKDLNESNCKTKDYIVYDGSGYKQISI